jgi:hypothetical protein
VEGIPISDVKPELSIMVYTFTINSEYSGTDEKDDINPINLASVLSEEERKDYMKQATHRSAGLAWSEISKVVRESKLVKIVDSYDINGVESLLTSDDVALRAIMVASDDKAVNDSLKNILDLRDCENMNMMKSISSDHPRAQRTPDRAGRRRNARRRTSKSFYTSKFARLVLKILKRLCDKSDEFESLGNLLHKYRAVSVKAINLMDSASLFKLAEELGNTDAPFACREMHLAATYARHIAQCVVEEEKIVRAILKSSDQQHSIGDIDIENIDLEKSAIDPEIPRLAAQNSSQRSILGSSKWAKCPDIFSKRGRDETVDARGKYEIGKLESLSLQRSYQAESQSITDQSRQFMEECKERNQTSPKRSDEQPKHDDSSTMCDDANDGNPKA